MAIQQKPQTEARANLIVDSLNNKPKMMGLDFGSIVSVIMELLPIIINCFDPDDGPQSVQYVSARYTDADKGNEYRGYSRSLARSMARNAKQAARRKGQRITWAQGYEIGFAALDDIREGDPQQASVAISENHNFLLI